jgi:hypothetical protein
MTIPMASQTTKRTRVTHGRCSVNRGLDNFFETLRLTNKIDADHKIIEHLEAFTEIYPKEVIECITLMLEGEKEGWGLLDWGKKDSWIIGI